MTETHWLFSCGTLQAEKVQLATFGRRLGGSVDALPGLRAEMVKITESTVQAA